MVGRELGWNGGGSLRKAWTHLEEVDWTGGPIGGRPDTRSNMPSKGDMKSLDMTSTIKPLFHLDAHLKEMQ